MGNSKDEESRRLSELARFHILDTLEEVEFDAFTRLAAEICDTPVSMISLIDRDRQWFKAHFGTDVTETPLEDSFCKVALDRGETLVVPDATLDPHFKSYDSVVSGDVRFYAGALLKSSQGVAIGTLCVVDTKPRTINTDQIEALQTLADKVVLALESRHAKAQLSKFEIGRDMLEELSNAGSWEYELVSKSLKWTPHVFRVFGVDPKTFTPSFESILQLVHPDDRHIFLEQPAPPEAEFRILRPDGATRILAQKSVLDAENQSHPARVIGTVRDITEVRIVDRRQSWAAEILEAVRTNQPADEVLTSVAVGLEELIGGVTVAVSLLSRNGRRIVRTLAPSLPDEFARAFENTVLGPHDGSSAVAVLERKTIISADIESAPEWSNKRAIASKFGFRSCWASPIQDHTGKVRGTLAVYLKTSAPASKEQIAGLERTASLSALALTRDSMVSDRNEGLEFLRIAGKAARIGGWTATLPEGRIVWSNEVLDILEYPDDWTITIENGLDAYSPDSQKRIITVFERCIAKGTSFDLELLATTYTQKTIWVRLAGEGEMDEDGQIRLIRGVLADITERKLAEESLAESEEKYRDVAIRLARMLENITDAFISFSPDWRFTYVNAEAERLLGSTREELVGQDVWTIFADAANFRKHYESALQTQTAVFFEEYLEQLDAWYQVRAYPSTDGLAVYFHDISETRRQREQLREQATLLDKAQDAILVRNLDHEIIYWNESAKELYGWTLEEAKVRSLLSFWDDPAPFLAATEATIRDGEWIGELTQRTKSGDIIQVQGRWTLVRDASGHPKSILAINTNITEKKKLEQQFLRAQRMETVGTLAGGIAHDLNNVLTPILMSASLLKEDLEDQGHSGIELVNAIETSAKRGADMVHQLLSFARGVDGKRASIKLKALIQDIQSILEKTFPKSIDLNFDIPPNVWVIEGDSTQLHQVLTNLCVNARDAMPDGGLLSVKLENAELDEVFLQMNPTIQPGKFVVITVEDSGQGMSPEVLDRIFEPFFTTKEIGKGTGLGLSTAHAIVKSHNGFMHAYSELGRGTLFKIYLPAYSRYESGQTLAIASPVPSGRGELVLIVDDELTIRTIAKQMLEKYGYRVILAANGAEAISLYAQNKEDVALVITDMAMPVMDGPKTIVALRALRPNLPIIGSSGFTTSSIGTAGYAGVTEFVSKPYNAETMLRVIAKVLDNQ